MAEYLESAGPEADLTAAPPVAVASTSPAVTQPAVVDPEIEKKKSGVKLFEANSNYGWYSGKIGFT